MRNGEPQVYTEVHEDSSTANDNASTPNRAFPVTSYIEAEVIASVCILAPNLIVKDSPSNDDPCTPL